MIPVKGGLVLDGDGLVLAARVLAAAWRAPPRESVFVRHSCFGNRYMGEADLSTSP